MVWFLVLGSGSWFLNLKLGTPTKKCSDFLQRNINIESALTALTQSLFFEEKKVVEKCLRIIGGSAVQIIEQKAFLELDKATLMEILKSDDLVIPEIDLFRATEKWSIHKLIEDGREICPESKREILGDALYLLRFPTMLSKEFCKHCLYSGLLTQQESNDLLHILCLDREDQNDGVFDRIPFPKEPRKKNKTVLIYRLTSGRVGVCRGRANGDVEFTVNRRAWLHGFSLFGSPLTTEVTDVIITKYNDRGRLECRPGFKIMNVAPVNDRFYVSLSKGVPIWPKEKINVSFHMNGTSTSYGRYSSTEFEKHGLVCKFIGASNGEIEGNAIQGQFPELVFKI